MAPMVDANAKSLVVRLRAGRAHAGLCHAFSSVGVVGSVVHAIRTLQLSITYSVQ